MIKYFKQAFTITNNNIILTTPFILFLIIIGVFLGLTPNLLSGLSPAMLLVVTLLFMFAAFFAGWLYLIQAAINNHHENIQNKSTVDVFVTSDGIEKADKSSDDEQNIKTEIIDVGERKQLPVIKTMITGVGEYFLSFVTGIILYALLLVLFVVAGKYAGSHFIGNVNVSFSEFAHSMNSNAQLQNFLAGIPREELIKISKWNVLIAALTSTFSFLTMFWSCAVINTAKNPIKAFGASIKFIFKNFLNSIILFVYISIINLCVTAINGAFASNNVLYFISTLIYFYFVVYIIVLVFLYYDEQQCRCKIAE